jgi:hypothetical protein
MSVFQLEQKSSVEFEVPPVGAHPAVLVGLIDLGTKSEAFGNTEPKKRHTVFLVWEILGEKDTKGKPFFLGRRETLSINEKSNLGQLIGEWRGKPLAKDEGFDVTKLVGKSCILNVSHKQSTKGNTFAIAGNVSPLPKEMAKTAGKASVETLSWTFRDDKGKVVLPPTQAWIPYVHGQPLLTVLQEADEWEGPKLTGGNGAPGDNEPDDDTEAF